MGKQGAQVVVASPCVLGEGPVWDADRDRLLWLDIPQQDLHVYVPQEGRHDTIDLPHAVSCVAVTDDGRLVLAGDGAVHLAGVNGDDPALLADLPMPEGTRTNDGACDPFGRLWIGTADVDPKGDRAKLFRVSGDGRVDVVRTHLSMSNGIGWSPDATRCYHVDTRAARVDVLHLDSAGEVRETRPFVTVAGMPDGLAVDADGGVWVAFWDEHVVRRYTPSGALDDVLEVPAGFVTSCAFGPAGTGELFITTASQDLPDSTQERFPDSGALFRADVGIDGCETFRFAA